MITCDMCGGDSALLGFLGKLAHFRCQDCGWQFSIPASDLEDEEADLNPDD